MSELAPFLEWCDRQKLLPIPLAPKDIALFVRQSETLGIETIAETLEAISFLYISRGLADPTAGGPVAAEINRIAPIEPPRSWPKEDWPLFKSLPFQLQECISVREAQRDKRLKQAMNEAAAARKELEKVKTREAA